MDYPPPLPVICLLSAESYKLDTSCWKSRKKRKKNNTPKIDPEVEAELTLAATAWRAWTGKNSSMAPWMAQNTDQKVQLPAIRLTSVPSVTRFDRQLRVLFQHFDNTICFCGTSGTLHGIPLTAKQKENVFRVCLVFWSPMYKTALKGAIEKDSHEMDLFFRIQSAWSRARKAKKKSKVCVLPQLDISLAYVIPRWRRRRRHARKTGSYVTKLIMEEPRVLSYGMWQLITRFNLIKPHVVISTSKATSLIISNLAKLDPSDVIGEKHPTPALMQMESERGLQCGVMESINNLYCRTYHGRMTHTFSHFRSPHPMQLLAQKEENTSLDEFRVIMHGVVLLATTRSQAAKMPPPPPKMFLSS